MSLTNKEAGHRPVLVVLCGTSHVGKTTFAQQLSKLGKDFIIISPDEIRKRLSVSFNDPEPPTHGFSGRESLHNCLSHPVLSAFLGV